jgi:hypothetical protein
MGSDDEDNALADKAAEAQYKQVTGEVLDSLARVFPGCSLILMVQPDNMPDATAIMTYGHLQNLASILQDTLKKVGVPPPNVTMQ